MKLNEEKIDDITGNLIKKSGIEEPPAFFTERVMQSVQAIRATEPENHKLQYLWSLLTIPAFIIVGLYLSAFPEIMNKSLKIIDSIVLYFNSFFSGLSDSFHQLANISFSPILLIGSLAILFLLILDTILTRKRYHI